MPIIGAELADGERLSGRLGADSASPVTLRPLTLNPKMAVTMG